MQVIQGVHTCGQVAITNGLHCWLLYRGGKVYVFCDAEMEMTTLYVEHLSGLGRDRAISNQLTEL